MHYLIRLKNFYNAQFLLNRSVLVVTTSFLASIFNYLFQLFLGRYFSVEDYAVITALLSITGIAPLFLLFFTNGLPKLVAEIKDDDYPVRISRLFHAASYISFLMSLITFTGIIIFTPYISSYLKVSDRTIFPVFALSVALGIYNNFIPKYLQGLLRFKAFALVTFLRAVLRFGVVAIVIHFNRQVVDVFKGLSLVALLFVVMGFVLLKKNIVFKLYQVILPDVITLLRYSVGAALGFTCIFLIQNCDVLLVKHFFPEALAGVYSAVVVVGRIVFFVASPVVTVMLPVCASHYKKGENYFKTFLVSLAITLSVALPVTLVYILFPKTIVGLLFGEKYLLGSIYLGRYAIYMAIYTTLITTVWFLIAISKFFLSSLLFVSFLIQILGIYFYHANLVQIINVCIFSTAFMLFVYIVLLYRDFRLCAYKKC